MNPIRHKHRRATTDPTGWLLGTTIVVLAMLDLLVWAALWNVPNPLSKLLLPQAVDMPRTMSMPFHDNIESRPGGEKPNSGSDAEPVALPPR